jgi:hypothetical protein
MTDEPDMSDPAERAKYDDTFREGLCDWLRANGISPEQVPADERPILVGDKLTIRLFKGGETGNQVWDPNSLGQLHGTRVWDPDTDAPVTFVATLPISVSPTDDVLLWLAPSSSPGVGA